MSRFGTFLFGATEFLRRRIFGGSKRIACVGDIATHSGSITLSGQDGKLKVNSLEVAVTGAIFNCDDHGNQTITSIITKTRYGGKLLITEGAQAGCGAVIKPPNRNVFAG